MKNYYEYISLTPYASTEDIKKSIHKKRKDVSKMKIHKEHKKKIEKELNDIEFILLDYHRRREYDNYFYIYFFPNNNLQKHKFKHQHIEEQTEDPYIEQYEEETTPSIFFENEMIPSFYQNFQMNNPSHSQIFTSQSSSFIQSGTDGTMVYRKNYQNINGKEEKKEEKYFIDKNGQKRQLLL